MAGIIRKARKAVKSIGYNLVAYDKDRVIKLWSKRYSVKQLRDASANFSTWKPLSKEQKKEIAEYWSIRHPVKSDFYLHEIMMNVKGKFDVTYCPHVVFRRYLDDPEGLRLLTDKNYYDRRQPGLAFPYTCVRNVNGCFLDHDYHLISREEARAIIIRNLPLIIKPSIDSGEGKNLRLIADEKQADEILPLYKKDFLLQRLVVQCDELKKMGNHSVNSMRVITAMINGRAKVLTSHLLCNTTDSIAVNVNTAPGVGVVIVKVNSDGKLADHGYYENAKRIEQLPSGFVFGGLQIPSFRESLELALEAHNSMPMLDFIGWDITIDETGKPLFIEWNQRLIEVYHSQLTNGPLFGEDVDYFAEKVRKKVYGKR